MGIGDEIMASGEARELARSTGKQVVIVDGGGRPRWEKVWDNVPFLEKEMRDDRVTLCNSPGRRSYIESVRSGKYQFRPEHRPTPGTLIFTKKENGDANTALRETFSDFLEFPRFVVFEPNIKGTITSDNKRWPWRRWQDLVGLLAPIPVVQLGERKERTLVGVKRITTPAFRAAAAILRHAAVLVTTDGALHHAAAALGVPAVVIWGGYSSPEILGYPVHENLYPKDGRSPCGSIRDCEHCKQCMDRITVDEVKDAIMRLW